MPVLRYLGAATGATADRILTPSPVAIILLITTPQLSYNQNLSPAPVTILLVVTEPVVTVQQLASAARTWGNAWQGAWV